MRGKVLTSTLMACILSAFVVLNCQLSSRNLKRHFAKHVASVAVLNIRRDTAATSPAAEVGM
jgi:hypothetical protein